MREYLKKMRRDRSFTQRHVANELLISRTGYANIENGERQKDMSISIIAKLAQLYEVNPNVIVQLEEKYQQDLREGAQ